MRFVGKRESSLEIKGRLTVPREHRKRLGKEVIVTKSNGCVRVYPLKRATEFPPSKIWRKRIDKEGRIVIPVDLIKSTSLAAFLGGKVVWVGEGNYLEIRPKPEEVEMTTGIRIPYDALTLEEAQELERHRVAVVGDGDRKASLLRPE